jgi:hypothetical protein
MLYVQITPPPAHTHTPAGPMTLRLTSPHAPSVLPMFFTTLLNTVLRSCFSTPCSWYAWRVVRRSVPLPNYSTTQGGHTQLMVRYVGLLIGLLIGGCCCRCCCW